MLHFTRCRRYIPLIHMYFSSIRWAAPVVALGRISKGCICQIPRSFPPAPTEGTLQGPRSLGDSVRTLTVVIPGISLIRPGLLGLTA